MCQPQIRQAVLATGLTEKQVKVNNCVQLIDSFVWCSGHTQHGLSTDLSLTIWCNALRLVHHGCIGTHYC